MVDISTAIQESLIFLGEQTWLGLFMLFWFSFLLEAPRFGFALIAIGSLRRRPKIENHVRDGANVSVVIVGHNEAARIARCAHSLHEQTLEGFEIIIVSDGSTDGMADVAAKLQKDGVITRALSTSARAGKAAAINLAGRFAQGEFIIVVDADGSFDRFSLSRILAPFEDPQVGIASGNVLVRNAKHSLIASSQAVEYIVTLSLGREILDHFAQVSCASGAFSAFRKTALDQIRGMDMGSGEDFDLTLRARDKGWKVRFVPEAVCYTDVPTTLWRYIKQRLRWERDNIRLRLRKHGRILKPSSRHFRLQELYHNAGFFIFNVVAGFAMPIYLVWLFMTYSPDIALMAIVLTAQVLIVFNCFAYLIGALRMGGRADWRNVVFVPAYSLINDFIMRFVRLYAYFSEWFFNASAHDPFVPLRVRTLRKW